jgi:hypothetical protein
MPGLPAICDTCLTVWDPRVFDVANSTYIDIKDVTVRPCPSCGGVGHIPDGIYSVTTDTISVVATTAKSAQSLATLLRILQQARNRRSTAAELATSLEQEQAANLKPVADLVRQLPKKLDIKYWIGIAIAVAALLEGQVTDHKVDRIESQVEKIYAGVLAQRPVAPPNTASASTSGQNPLPKVGRNDTCPCGSGRKYKRCHGT